jgi:hypothetical protein
MQNHETIELATAELIDEVRKDYSKSKGVDHKKILFIAKNRAINKIITLKKKEILTKRLLSNIVQTLNMLLYKLDSGEQNEAK